MITPSIKRGLLGGLLLLLSAVPIYAGQLLWTPGGELPALVLSLGDGAVKKSLDLPSGAGYLDLTLKKYLLDNPQLIVVWKNDGALWLRQVKKIPGDQTTDRVALPPGRQSTLEILTSSGTSVASIKLRRN